MKLSTASFLLALTLGFFASFNSAVKADEPAAEQFRVMSFNSRYANTNDGENAWENRKETFAEVVKENDPLLLGLQEALYTQVEYLAGALDGYKWVGVGRDDGKKKGEMMAIFYKADALELLDSGTFWISETPDKPGKGWDAQCNRTVTWTKFRCQKSGKEFVYFNTHLDHRGKTARTEGAKLVLSRAWELTNHGELPFFLSGDFNVTSKSDAYKTITKGMDDIPGLVDTNAAAKEHDIAQPYTAHGFKVLEEGKGNIIDFVFVNDKVNVEKFKINPVKHSNGRFASDHCSIVATLSFK